MTTKICNLHLQFEPKAQAIGSHLLNVGALKLTESIDQKHSIYFAIVALCTDFMCMSSCVFWLYYCG